MDDIRLEQALATVYAAAYSASGEHKGMEAKTEPLKARNNARAACADFLSFCEENGIVERTAFK